MASLRAVRRPAERYETVLCRDIARLYASVCPLGVSLHGARQQQGAASRAWTWTGALIDPVVLVVVIDCCAWGLANVP